MAALEKKVWLQQKAQILHSSCHFHFTKNPKRFTLLKNIHLSYASSPLELNTTLHRCWLKAASYEQLRRKETQEEVLPVCFLVHWGVKLRWVKRRESIAWLVREVFHPSACCPLANPQSPSSLFQHRKIQRGEGQNCVRTFAPDRGEPAAKQYAIEVSTMNGNIPSPLLFLCVSVCVPVLAH